MRKSPERRALRIFAFDPMISRAGDHRVTVEVPYRKLERTERSFWDDRLEVVDYDAAADVYYKAVQLDDAAIAMQQGIEPSDSDPQFHQQMVYAVASRVLENFDRALGRRLRFWGGARLRLMPHAFQGSNAYFDDDLNAVLFGYFSADVDDPGANLPGQLIFTCLSHDIVAHEVAHAALSRLHRRYSEPTNAQVPALHEAFADIVALFQRLTFPEVVAAAIRETRNNLLDPKGRLLDIGAQFGSAAGKGHALRSIAATRDPSKVASTTEPHALGWILVSAVYDGFVDTYERRTRDLIRIATGGSGKLPDGELHPDLVNRLAGECVRTAQTVLSMCIRATDYLPPVDPTFSDYLRAMITADFELNRSDETGVRASMIEAFRQRGIRPQAVGSLAVESLLLEAQPDTAPKDIELARIVADLVEVGARELGRTTGPAKSSTYTKRPRAREVTSRSDWDAQQYQSLSEPPREDAQIPETEEPDDDWRSLGGRLGSWVKLNRPILGLEIDIPAAVVGFHPVHRIAATGELLVEMVAQIVQTMSVEGDLGGLRYRAGLTLVANIDGQIRYYIRKPFRDDRKQALRDRVTAFDDAYGMGWKSRNPEPNRIVAAYSARAMDARRWR
ncbi:hypothetical protein A5792_03900 [Mycolicibacterium peregrinum]|uniref:Peptidase M4 n=1 Tax=Mycolicibacterium peregrinum TaxID=43304 RepID=A0A1A0QVN2_MYCPR|nr:hypothetical protein [Mycolicibacterium peregrinum]OBB26255.1 hypothetical protein A5792_03900 [Mycolicibacterium peregrinum]